MAMLVTITKIMITTFTMMIKTDLFRLMTMLVTIIKIMIITTTMMIHTDLFRLMAMLVSVTEQTVSVGGITRMMEISPPGRKILD